MHEIHMQSCNTQKSSSSTQKEVMGELIEDSKNHLWLKLWSRDKMPGTLHSASQVFLDAVSPVDDGRDIPEGRGFCMVLGMQLCVLPLVEERSGRHLCCWCLLVLVELCVRFCFGGGCLPELGHVVCG